MQQAEPGVGANIVGHGRDTLAQLFQFRHRAPGDARRRLLAHGVHHHLRRIQRQQAIGLIAVRQEGAGHGLADQQRNHRMAGEARRSIGVGRSGAGQVDAQQFLAPPIGLAADVNQGDNRPARAVAVGGDDAAHLLRQGPAFFKADFTIARTGKTVVRIGHHRDETGGRIAQGGFGRAHRCRSARNRAVLGGECLQPDGAAARRIVWRAHACATPPHRALSAKTSGGCCGSIAARRAR